MTTKDLAAAIASAQAHRAELMRLPGVIAVRGGYKFVDGRITSTPAVVVAVDRKQDKVEADAAVPAVLPDGMPTDVTVADPFERIEAAGLEAPAVAAPPLLIEQLQAPGRPPGGDEAEAEAIVAITYQPPPGVSLAPVTGPMVLTCHVSPDAGWRVLREFLRETEGDITLGMYDFTAPHIYRAVRRLLQGKPVTWRQTLGLRESLPAPDDIDSNKADDKTEASIIKGLGRVAPDRFENAFAKTGRGRTFASAYHIKVAVRDEQAFWLSSGNWQSSNQPVTDFLDDDADRHLIRDFNREWHIVVEHPGLAATFGKFLQHDFRTAQTEQEAVEPPEPDMPDLLVPLDGDLEAAARRAPDVFAPARFSFDEADPLTIEPILTPDNYAEVVLGLLRERPQQKLYFQNQSLNPVLQPSPAWAEMLRLLAEYSQDPALDVRIILRDIGSIRKKLESLQAAGFDMTKVRVQEGCHTKGIVIDSETVLLGSHNWTDQGVQVNRDASLLIRRPEIAQYYERVFLHDWERMARSKIREEAMPIPVVSQDEAVDPGLRRVPWSAWEEE
ncbi:phospholipase D-like domain-containing protein [Phytohabitans sp. LJ34]|uniref:phospholipase D-like domain-containing protein n=1 Tax=Phytohabitans sp. LJ34 TaxID=3452217 RepID=UPI003F89CAFB